MLGLVLRLFKLYFLLGVDTAGEKPTSAQGSPDENSSELSTSGCIGGSETLSEANCNKGNICLIGMSTLCSQKREGFISKVHDSLTGKLAQSVLIKSLVIVQNYINFRYHMLP